MGKAMMSLTVSLTAVGWALVLVLFTLELAQRYAEQGVL